VDSGWLYRPTTSGGFVEAVEEKEEIQLESCSEPIAYYKMNIGEGVSGRLVAITHESGLKIIINIALQLGATFQFQEAALRVEGISGSDSSTTNIGPISVETYHGSNKWSGPSYPVLTEDPTSLLEGRNRNAPFVGFPGVDPQNAMVDRFYMGTLVLPVHPERFVLTLPNIRVNGKDIQLNPLGFEKAQYRYWIYTTCGI
jgi:hypothetical protein